MKEITEYFRHVAYHGFTVKQKPNRQMMGFRVRFHLQELFPIDVVEEDFVTLRCAMKSARIGDFFSSEPLLSISMPACPRLSVLDQAYRCNPPSV